MPLVLFEVLSALIVALSLGAMARVHPWKPLLAEYALLAVASWVGEESCVGLYRFYAYSDAWHGHLHLVPVLVPLIWPVVILSARDVSRALWPNVGPWAAACLVAFDASLVEVIAVRAGLWHWAEPGHLGVPLIGILGWGYFALGALAPKRRGLAVVAGPLVAHALIQLTWWGCFRWALRGELGHWGFAILGAATLAFLVGAMRARRRGTMMAPPVWLPRVIAALLFFALLVWTAPGDPWLWLHTAMIAVPYLVVTEIRSRAAPLAATAPSR